MHCAQNMRDDTILSNSNLLTLADNISPDNAVTLGIYLGLSSNEIDQIQRIPDNSNNPVLAVYSIMAAGCDMLILSKGRTIQQSADALSAALKNLRNWDACHALKKLRTLSKASGNVEKELLKSTEHAKQSSLQKQVSWVYDHSLRDTYLAMPVSASKLLWRIFSYKKLNLFMVDLRF